MKIAMDERLKHRLVGLAVILSLGVIFGPAMLKKSNQHLDEKSMISIRLPPKPVISQITVPKEEVLFQQIKKNIPVVVPAIKLPQVAASNVTAKAVPVSGLQRNNHFNANRITVNTPSSSHAPLILPKNNTVVAVVKSPLVKHSIHNKNSYAVQLALFLEQRNAIALVNRLKSKGYDADYIQIKNGQKIAYKVIAGKTDQKQQALNLQKKIAVAMQIKGFVVSRGLS